MAKTCYHNYVDTNTTIKDFVKFSMNRLEDCPPDWLTPAQITRLKFALQHEADNYASITARTGKPLFVSKNQSTVFDLLPTTLIID